MYVYDVQYVLDDASATDDNGMKHKKFSKGEISELFHFFLEFPKFDTCFVWLVLSTRERESQRYIILFIDMSLLLITMAIRSEIFDFNFYECICEKILSDIYMQVEALGVILDFRNIAIKHHKPLG